jgi:hypothetical protein
MGTGRKEGHNVDVMVRSRSARCIAQALLALLVTQTPTASSEPRRHVLTFYSEGFAVAVREPEGWFADSTIARDFGADVILYPAAGDPYLAGTPVIRVSAMRKIHDDASADLDDFLDLRGNRDANAVVRDAAVTHARYRVHAKSRCAPKAPCSFVAFVDPAAAYGRILSVTLVTAAPSDASTLAAYRLVVASLEVE